MARYPMRKFLQMFVMTSAFAAHGACDDVIWLLSGAPDEEEETVSQLETIQMDVARLAERAREEAERLVALARAGTWPPPVVDEWTLTRIRELDATAG